MHQMKILCTDCYDSLNSYKKIGSPQGRERLDGNKDRLKKIALISM